MNWKKALLIIILITSLTSSVLLVPVYGITDDTEPVIFFNLTYEPTLATTLDEVNVMCSVEGVYINVFTDDFERAEIGLNWTGMIGTWTIEKGHLIQSEVEDFQIIFTGNSTWSNYILKLKVKKVGTVENTLNIIFRKGKNDALSDLYLFSLRGNEPKVGIYKGSGDPYSSSEWPVLAKTGFQHSADIWYNVLIQVHNDRIKSKIWAEGNSEPIAWLFELSDGDYELGKIGLLCGNQAAFDDIEVYTHTMTGIKEVNLWYSVNNGTLKEISMAPDDDGDYNAIIPKQAAETSVSIYVEAVDDSGNIFNSQSISYVVQFPPPIEIPWSTIGIAVSAVSIIVAVWFAFRKGYLAIEIIE